MPIAPFSKLMAMLGAVARRLRADRGGNVFIMMAFAAGPLIFAIGFGVDYSRAEKLQTQLNAAADAAALAAVDPSMINRTDAEASAAATAMFNAQAANLPGLQSYTLNPPSFTPAANGGSLGSLRTIRITYTALSKNVFSGILGYATLPITGSATASASQPPSINFYVALDTSPSMLLPTTSAGIGYLNAGAPWPSQGVGCDFACHSVNMQQWNNGVFVVDSAKNSIYTNNTAGSAITFYRVSCSGVVTDNNKNAVGTKASTGYASSCSGSGPPVNPIGLKYLPTGLADKSANYVTVSVNYPDTWWLARNYAAVNPGQSQVLLRTDAEGTAAQNLITYAYSVEQQYISAQVPPNYQMQFYTFNVGTPAVLSTSPFGTMTDVSTSRKTTFPDLGANPPLLAAINYWTTLTNYTANGDSDFGAMLSGMKSAMPATSGNGTPSSPQSVLMIITDGAVDTTADGRVALTQANIDKCTAIKATGTRIAILYTEYVPETVNYTSNSIFNTFAKSAIPQILPQLQACASQTSNGTYLLQTVSTDQDISAALNTLFSMSVQSARLIQ